MFNPNGITPVDAYEIPTRIRRAVLQRHPYDVFPYGTHTSAGLDLDHTDPYRWDGTPAQTRPDNLGPLRRKAHRAKTHAGWRVKQHEPGRFTWVSPLGRRYTVTTTGLTLDGRHAPGAEPWTNPLGGRLLPDPPTNVRNGRKRRRTRKPVPTTPRKPRPTLRP
ncbi:MAG: HNH endonuclease [Propionibacteriaceae bacterium]|nr:HNH endonuclease [Propionibacteriaceae bacterium]